MKKICPRCSNEFRCREDRTDLCHCTRIHISSDVKEYVRESYDCLCPKCLEETSISFHSFGVNPKYMVKKEIN